jgi:hypothetical protein
VVLVPSIDLTLIVSNSASESAGYNHVLLALISRGTVNRDPILPLRISGNFGGNFADYRPKLRRRSLQNPEEMGKVGKMTSAITV